MTTPRGLSAATLVLVLSFAASRADAEDWTTFRGDAFRRGNPTGAPLSRGLAVRWSFRCDDCEQPRFDASPCIVDGTVYTALADHSAFFPSGRVVAVDAATGALRWKVKTTHPVFSSPTVADGRVFVGEGYHENTECALRCLDAASGKELWSFKTTSHIESGPHVEGGSVWFGAGEDGMYCLGAADGSVVWHVEGEHVDISPLVSSGLVFAGVGYGESAALCLDARTGEPRWRTPVGLPVWGAPVRLGNRVYFGLGNGNLVRSAEKPAGAVVCLAATTGKVVWHADFPDAVLTAITYADRKLLAGCRDGNLLCLEPTSGAVAWRRDLGSALVASPVVGEKLVAAIASRGRLVLASIASGEVVGTFELGALLGDGALAIASPAAAPGVLIAGGGGALVALGDSGADTVARPAETPTETSVPGGTRIDVDPAAGTVTIDAVAAKQGVYEQLKGAIEYVLVSKGGKEYESLFWTACTPTDLAAAFRRLGAPAGRPATDGAAPRGAQFKLSAEYEREGARVRRPVAEFMRHSKDGSAVAPAPWTFTGSVEALDPGTGGTALQCVNTKCIVGLHYTDPSPLVQNGRAEARSENIYRYDADALPPAGTPVRLVFERVAAPTGVTRVHVFVTGRVQGVGFRAFTQREARRLELVGWVKNLADGRVEAVVEGPKEGVEKLIAVMKRGPRAARVEKLESEPRTALGDFSSFAIDY